LPVAFAGPCARICIVPKTRSPVRRPSICGLVATGAREGTHPQGMGHLHREAGGPEAAHQEPFIPAGGLAHRLCGPCTGHVLQQAADARAAVGEAVHGTFRNGYVQHGLRHIDTRYHQLDDYEVRSAHGLVPARDAGPAGGRPGPSAHTRKKRGRRPTAWRPSSGRAAKPRPERRSGAS